MKGSNEPLIALRGACFGYGTERVVSDVDLELCPGSFAAMLGPNGAGKTTLLRGILGLIAPVAGTVDRRRARIGYVPQRESLDPVYPITVEEVVQMGAYGRLAGLRRLSREERDFALECLRRVGLAERRAELFSRLSGGQRQRALIARALMTHPNVLLLDEPTSGVDRPTQDVIVALLERLSRDEALAILIVSHQLAVTRSVSRVVWVAGGHVLVGDADDMLRAERLEELFGAPIGRED